MQFIKVGRNNQLHKGKMREVLSKKFGVALWLEASSFEKHTNLTLRLTPTFKPLVFLEITIKDLEIITEKWIGVFCGTLQKISFKRLTTDVTPALFW